MTGAVILIFLIFIVALLFSSVGHGGASGYLAAMALWNVAPEVMKPTALVLNILVAGIATFKFYRSGYCSWSILWPFMATSAPFAFVGGSITLPGNVYRPVVGVVLLFAAIRLLTTARNPEKDKHLAGKFYLPGAMLAGAGIGLLSGMTGVGGGIFLTPFLLLTGWADTKKASGVSAAFILVNSIAGLTGRLSSLSVLPDSTPYWGAAAILGGWVGSAFGSQKLGRSSLRILLAAVVAIAGVKMVLLR